MTYIHDLKSSLSILKGPNTKNKNRTLTCSIVKHTFAEPLGEWHNYVNGKTMLSYRSY